MKCRPAVWTFCIVLAITGCSKKESDESSQPPVPTAVVDASTAGSITGTVKLDGPPPQFKAIDM